MPAQNYSRIKKVKKEEKFIAKVKKSEDFLIEKRRKKINLNTIIENYQNSDNKDEYLEMVIRELNSSPQERIYRIGRSVVAIFDFSSFSETKVYLNNLLKNDLYIQVSPHHIPYKISSQHERQFQRILRNLWFSDITELTIDIDKYFGDIISFYRKNKLPHQVRFVGDGYLLVLPLEVTHQMTKKEINITAKYKAETNRKLQEEIFTQARELLTKHVEKNHAFLKERKNGSLSNYRELNCTIMKSHSDCHLINEPTFEEREADPDKDHSIKNESFTNHYPWQSCYEFAGSFLDKCFRVNKQSGGYYIVSNKDFFEDLENNYKKMFFKQNCILKSSELRGAFSDKETNQRNEVELKISIIPGSKDYFLNRVKLIEDCKLITNKVKVLFLQEELEHVSEMTDKEKKVSKKQKELSPSPLNKRSHSLA